MVNKSLKQLKGNSQEFDNLRKLKQGKGVQYWEQQGSLGDE